MAITPSLGGMDDSTINVLVVPKAPKARKDALTKESRNLIMMALLARKQTLTDAKKEEFHKRFQDATAYLSWLDYSTDISSSDVEQSSIKTALRQIVDNAASLPANIVQQANDLATSFNSAIITEEADSADDNSDDDIEPVVATTTVMGTALAQIRLPPATHPIYGRNGIMHGVVVTRGKNNRIVRRLNPSLPKKPASVFGHNGLEPGAWFPLQLVALFNGAHGSSMGGISGNTQLGAYSIVIANTYDDLDTDDGDVVYYSGSNSHKNTDPNRPAESTQGTLALKASLRTRNPVRVLRSGGSAAVNNHSGNKYLPQAGIRYDGLYRIVNMRTPKNKKGGLYEQFRLERLPDQRPLSEIRRESPTTQQLLQLQNIQQGY